jgi:hypothetical protein
MDIQQFFDKKSQLEQAQKQLQDTKQSLVQSFDDNFYFKMNKRQTVTNDKLCCNLTISFFIPHVSTEITENKKVTEILFLTNLNFNQKHALQLTGFTGFNVTAKNREISQDRALLMMYPEIKISDLPPMEDSTYAIFKGMVKMQKDHISSQKFTDFCRQMITENPLIIKEINVHTESQDIDYTLKPKEQDVIFHKFNYLFNNLMESLDTGKKSYIKMDEFEDLLKYHTQIEKKRFHFALNNNLENKESPTAKMKI